MGTDYLINDNDDDDGDTMILVFRLTSVFYNFFFLILLPPSTHLQDSVTRLDLENRSLKDPSLEGSCQSLGTVACSQELEHLHKVVDTLKTTVLEQRSYLLNLSMYLFAVVFIFFFFSTLFIVK